MEDRFLYSRKCLDGAPIDYEHTGTIENVRFTFPILETLLKLNGFKRVCFIINDDEYTIEKIS